MVLGVVDKIFINVTILLGRLRYSHYTDGTAVDLSQKVFWGKPESESMMIWFGKMPIKGTDRTAVGRNCDQPHQYKGPVHQPAPEAGKGVGPSQSELSGGAGVPLSQRMFGKVAAVAARSGLSIRPRHRQLAKHK